MKLFPTIALTLLLPADATLQNSLATETTDPSINIQLIDLPGSVAEFELVSARRALLKLKDSLGSSALAELLKPDVEAANIAWHTIIGNSNTSSHVLAETHIRATPAFCDPKVKFTAESFLDWFARGQPDNMNKNLEAYPEHYGSSAALNPDGTISVDSLEGWGNLITHSGFPRYAPVGAPGVAKKPWLKELPDYPHQFVGEATLQDGSEVVFADAHYSFKDITESGACGVEILLALWLPPAVPRDIVESLKQHQAIEFNHWLPIAYEEIRTGVFVPAE
ncbi:hypothetical protein GQ53DRAFT_852299 [Thozetella sp. PMI_491]|nr:hypothetical protein GQ53DRAFT_852299 [Thozetella sp. PMI_491]